MDTSRSVKVLGCCCRHALRHFQKERARPGEWGPCSISCGSGASGTRSRTLDCVDTKAPGRAVVAPTYCKSQSNTQTQDSCEAKPCVWCVPPLLAAMLRSVSYRRLASGSERPFSMHFAELSHICAGSTSFNGGGAATDPARMAERVCRVSRSMPTANADTMWRFEGAQRRALSTPFGCHL